MKNSIISDENIFSNYQIFSFVIVRVVTRDIGGSDPERMSAPNVVRYIKDVFSGSDSGVHVKYSLFFCFF